MKNLNRVPLESVFTPKFRFDKRNNLQIYSRHLNNNFFLIERSPKTEWNSAVVQRAQQDGRVIQNTLVVNSALLALPAHSESEFSTNFP